MSEPAPPPRRARLRPADLAAGAFVLLCAIGTQAVEPLVTALDPDLAVSAAYAEGYVFFADFEAGQVAPGARDPWGNPWCWLKVDTPGQGNWYVGDVKPEYFAFYSAGPDGVNERLGGDDVLHRFHPAAPLVRRAPDLLVVIALLAVWLVAGPWARSPRGARLGPEVARALGLVSLPLLISLWGLYAAFDHPWAVSLQKTQKLAVPAPVAWYGSVVVLWLLVGVAIRLTRPLRGDGSPPGAA